MLNEAIDTENAKLRGLLVEVYGHLTDYRVSHLDAIERAIDDIEYSPFGAEIAAAVVSPAEELDEL